MENRRFWAFDTSQEATFPVKELHPKNIRLKFATLETTQEETSPLKDLHP
eukprot:CAMPEP_0194050950 /NCGR_PEP_ID=MMETSP0009_2-20130614/37838_1 /TAXON_ID=210454 /ORGANISM="Grammatophora oceanica, Strain CCMP 410" /LENGTH=49 /DNA_ID= /DNA_START= /DNA_END= /DNA_ORIENTATION=